MNRNEIAKLINDLDEFIKHLLDSKNKIPDSHPHLKVMIGHFADDVSILYDKLTSTGVIRANLIAVWATMIETRLRFSICELSSGEDKKIMEGLLKKFYCNGNFPLASKSESQIPLIYYSQKVCAPNFAEHQSNNKRDFPYCREYIPDVAKKLQDNPDCIDNICIRVTFMHFKNESAWVALNNRGLAAINLAGLTPLRYLPDEPTTEELNRLRELYGYDKTPKPDKSSPQYAAFIFFNNISKTEVHAPFKAITGVDRVQGKPMFTVSYYQSGSLNDNLPKYIMA
jgi:hypothetical protein